ncbi:MAG TPA: CoA-binding protein [Bacteroidales bacterium]
MRLRPTINLFLTGKQLAIAGVSRDPKKFGNLLFWTLKSKGYHVFPVNPNATVIGDNVCYRNLKDLPVEVENLLIVTPKKDTEKVMKEAIERGFKNIWIQNGCETAEAIKLAHNNHINLVSGCCILMYANPKGFHKLHQMVTKWIGKYEN